MGKGNPEHLAAGPDRKSSQSLATPSEDTPYLSGGGCARILQHTRSGLQIMQIIQQIQQGFVPVGSQLGLDLFGQVQRHLHVVLYDLFTFGGDVDNLATLVIGMSSATDQTLGFQFLQDSRQTGQQKARTIRYTRWLLRAFFFQNAQNAPLLFRYTRISQHISNRSHDPFARPQQCNRQ